MGYKKKTVKDFKDLLDAGHYAGITGARRGVGKFADWTDAERASAQKLIDAHFGDNTPTKTEKAPKQAKGKKKAAAKAAKTPKAQAKTAAKAPKPVKEEKPGRQKTPSRNIIKSSDELIHVSNNLAAIENVLHSIEAIKRIDQGFDVTPGLTEAHEGLRACLVRLNTLTATTGESSNGSKPAVAVSAALPKLATGGLPGFIPQS